MEPTRPTDRDDALDLLLRPPSIASRLSARIRGGPAGRTTSIDRRWWIVAVVVVVAVALGYGLTHRSVPVEVALPRATAGGSDPGSGSRADAGGSTGGGAATTTSAGPSLVVHVAGAVVRPGLVTLAGGSRAADAIAAAGGLRSDADQDRVNLAAPLADGTRLFVPAVGQVAPPVVAGDASSATTGSGAPPTPVDLNTATAEQLDTLPGVGPATAAAIIAYRDRHGPFRSVDGLADVRGIGPAKLEQLRDDATVG